MSPTLNHSPSAPADGGPITDHLVGVEDAGDNAWQATCAFEGWRGEVRHSAAEAVLDAREHEKEPLGEPDPHSPYNPQRAP